MLLLNSRSFGVSRSLATGSPRPSQERTGFGPSRVFGASQDETHLFPSPCSMQGLQLQPQEISYDAKASCNFFVPSEDMPFVATRAAVEQFEESTIVVCLKELQAEALKHDGLDYLQIFESSDKMKQLWFIEGGDGGAITALLPSDY